MTDSEPKVGSNVDADSFGPAWFLEHLDVKPISIEQMISTYQDGGRIGSSAGKRRTDFGGRHRQCERTIWLIQSLVPVMATRTWTTRLNTLYPVTITAIRMMHVQKARISMHHVGWLQMGSLFATAERRGSLMRLCGERCGGAQPFHRQTEWKETFAVRILNTELFSKEV